MPVADGKMSESVSMTATSSSGVMGISILPKTEYQTPSSCWRPALQLCLTLGNMQLSSAFLGSRFVLKSAPVPHVNAQAPRQVTCMAKKKGVRCIVTLECTEARGEGQTPSRYTTQKVNSRHLPVPGKLAPVHGRSLSNCVHCRTARTQQAGWS